MAKKSQPPTPLAFSYLRFSSLEQAKGDSVRRQTDLRDTWLAKSGAILDTSLSLSDKGVSGFTGKHRENPDRHALAAFLHLVQLGRIPRGSYLIVESLDRLSREHIRPALTLLLNLIDSGIRIVQLLPVETIYDDKVEPMTLMMAIMELSRGHSESRMKSERVGGAWNEKKRNAAKDKEPITPRVPGWLEVQGNKIVIIEDRANTVRRIYRMASEGHGLGAIAKRLNGESVPAIGRADYWARSYLAKILSTRAVLGEYLPHTARGGPRRPDGAPIPEYFPPIITEDQWHAARAALTSRRHAGGRPAPQVNIFQGLLRDARDGGSLHQVHKGKKGGAPLLASYNATLGIKGTKNVSFPQEVFERAILAALREIDPAEMLPRTDDATNRVQLLDGRVDAFKTKIEKVKIQLVDNEDLTPLVEVLKTLETKRAAAEAELATAQQEAASPMSAAWEQCHSLVDILDAAEDQDEARIRLRAAVRRIVESVWALFVGRASQRLAAVQIYFRGGKRRDYLILHRPATGGSVGVRAARWWCRSLAEATTTPEDLDLRKRSHVKRLEAVLASLDPATLL